MPKIKKRYIEVLQESDGTQQVILIPNNVVLCKFILFRKGSSTKNVRLIKAIEQAFETYFEDIIG